MKSNAFTKTVSVMLTLVMVGGQFPIVHAAEVEAVKNENIQVIKGDLYSYETNNLTRVSVTDPDVADISDAKGDKILLLGKKSGQTILFVWDDDGKHSVNVTVVAEDLTTVKKRIDSILAKAGFNQVVSEVDMLEGKVVLSGQVAKSDQGDFEKLVDPFNDSVMNLVKEENSEELIQIDMQITELSTTLSKKMGFVWPDAVDYNENFPAGGYGTGSKDWFKISPFNRVTGLTATINALINEGKARDLSRPRILVTSGKEATINVGGEVPISSTTSSASTNTTQSNVTFKQYGVTLTVTPTIRNGKIDIVMNAQVTDVDKTFAANSGVTQSTTNDVAYKTRSAQTQLMLEDRQTIVFAGLIRYSDSEQVKRVPILGKIPVVGLLFRNRSNDVPNEGKELVITLTPVIVRKKEFVTDQIKLPTKKLVEFDKEVMKSGEYEKEALPDAPAKVVVPVVPVVEEGTVTTDYVRGMQQRIAQSISYPEAALQDKAQGTVKLKLIVRKDGTLARADVEESSGKDVFDQDALNTAKMVAPYAKFPNGITQEQITVTIPIIYSQTSK